MGRLTICGKYYLAWEVFSCIGILPIREKTSHVREVFPYYMGGLPMYGKVSNVWEVLLYMGLLPTHGKTSQVWADVPNRKASNM
jgi:hypothetical protein